MSDHYVPTTEEVREGYRPYGFKSLNRAEFNRWLMGIKADAWDEGREAEKTAWVHAFKGHPVGEGEMCYECPTGNPYRKED